MSDVFLSEPNASSRYHFERYRRYHIERYRGYHIERCERYHISAIVNF